MAVWSLDEYSLSTSRYFCRERSQHSHKPYEAKDSNESHGNIKKIVIRKGVTYRRPCRGRNWPNRPRGQREPLQRSRAGQFGPIDVWMQGQKQTVLLARDFVREEILESSLTLSSRPNLGASVAIEW
jgi:hypothetical protein